MGFTSKPTEIIQIPKPEPFLVPQEAPAEPERVGEPVAPELAPA